MLLQSKITKSCLKFHYLLSWTHISYNLLIKLSFNSKDKAYTNWTV